MTPVSPRHLEVEIKIKLTDLSLTRQRLPELGFAIQDRRQFEHNVLFDTPDHSLASRKNLLRLRRYGQKNVITFKRPAGKDDKDKNYKIREEIESGFEHFDNMKTILLGLGYQVAWMYEKYRETWRREGATVFLDETPIGDFMEIEGETEEIDALARDFGYSKNDYIAVNYRRLWADAGQNGDMTFDEVPR